MELFLPVFVAAIFMIINPGPETMAITSLAMAGRWKSIIIFWLSGITAGTIMYFLVLSGFSLIPEKFGIVFIFLKALAAIFFLSLGLSSLGSSVQEDIEKSSSAKEAITKQSFFQTMGAGFVLIISNPYNIGFIFAAIPAITEKTVFSLMDITLIRSAVVAADFLVLICYVVPLLMVRGFLSPRILGHVRILSAFAMIGIGVFIVINMFVQGDLKHAGLL